MRDFGHRRNIGLDAVGLVQFYAQLGCLGGLLLAVGLAIVAGVPDGVDEHPEP